MIKEMKEFSDDNEFKQALHGKKGNRILLNDLSDKESVLQILSMDANQSGIKDFEFFMVKSPLTLGWIENG